MIFQVQNINQIRNNQLKFNKIHKHYLKILSLFMFAYFVYFDIYYIKKFINDKEFKEYILTNLKDNLWWKTLLIIVSIILGYYINFVYYKWQTKKKKLYKNNIFLIIISILSLFNIIAYFILGINFDHHRDL